VLTQNPHTQHIGNSPSISWLSNQGYLPVGPTLRGPSAWFTFTIATTEMQWEPHCEGSACPKSSQAVLGGHLEPWYLLPGRSVSFICGLGPVQVVQKHNLGWGDSSHTGSA
jgi:hypothetical protein